MRRQHHCSTVSSRACISDSGPARSECRTFGTTRFPNWLTGFGDPCASFRVCSSTALKQCLITRHSCRRCLQAGHTPGCGLSVLYVTPPAMNCPAQGCMLLSQHPRWQCSLLVVVRPTATRKTPPPGKQLVLDSNGLHPRSWGPGTVC
jgi:hypothetical protein